MRRTTKNESNKKKNVHISVVSLLGEWYEQWYLSKQTCVQLCFGEDNRFGAILLVFFDKIDKKLNAESHMSGWLPCPFYHISIEFDSAEFFSCVVYLTTRSKYAERPSHLLPSIKADWIMTAIIIQVDHILNESRVALPPIGCVPFTKKPYHLWKWSTRNIVIINLNRQL